MVLDECMVSVYYDYGFMFEVSLHPGFSAETSNAADRSNIV
jgi:hypothetical protein